MLEWIAAQPAEVKVAVVALISAVAVAFIQYRRGKPTDHAEVAGAIIDNKAISRLSESVDHLAVELKSFKGAASRMADQVDDSFKAHGSEVSRLREELIRRERDSNPRPPA